MLKNLILKLKQKHTTAEVSKILRIKPSEIYRILAGDFIIFSPYKYLLFLKVYFEERE